MAAFLHDHRLGPVDGGGRALGILRGAGIVVLAGQQVERAAAGVDQMGAVAVVGILAVEVEVAFEDPRPALHVAPQGLPAVLVRRLRRHQAGDHGGADLAAMDVAAVQPARVVPGGLMVGAFDADQGAEPVGVVGAEVEDDAPAHGAADQRRSVEFHGVGDGEDGVGIEVGGQPVLLLVEADRRVRLAVPGQVEGDDAEMLGDVRVGHHVPVLAAVGAGGVKAEQRDTLPRLLDIDPAGTPSYLDGRVAADDRFILDCHGQPLPAPVPAVARGAASTSFT